MKIGITGTRRGLTQGQGVTLLERMLYKPECDEVHHGACVGADEEVAVYVANIYDWIKLIAHPGKSARGGENEHLSQAALDVSHEVREADTHFSRNRRIVDSTDFLVATPWQTERPAKQTGGGTWQTIEYAEKRGKRVHILWPNGTETILNPQAPGPASLG